METPNKLSIKTRRNIIFNHVNSLEPKSYGEFWFWWYILPEKSLNDSTTPHCWIEYHDETTRIVLVPIVYHLSTRWYVLHMESNWICAFRNEKRLPKHTFFYFLLSLVMKLKMWSLRRPPWSLLRFLPLRHSLAKYRQVCQLRGTRKLQPPPIVPFLMI